MRLPNFLRVVAFAAAAATATAAQAADISGAGATFPFPIYAKWADAYKKDTGNGLNYQSIGSGAGIKQIKARTVTFGATDAPLEPKELEKAGLAQWPMVMGGIVAVVNLPGRQARRHCHRRANPGSDLSRQDHQLERSSAQGDSIPSSTSPICRSCPSIALTARARPSTSPTISAKSRRIGNRRSAWRPRLTGQAASAPRAMTASPTMSPPPRARSAMSNSLTPIRTS